MEGDDAMERDPSEDETSERGEDKDEHEHKHEGSFATGVEKTERHPERESEGDYAKGHGDAEHEHDDEHEHEGSFATGVEKTEHHPERESKGDFAEGLEKDDRS
jgi:hypothetical protein